MSDCSLCSVSVMLRPTIGVSDCSVCSVSVMLRPVRSV